MIHDKDNSNSTRVIIANAKPSWRAFFCLLAGSLDAMIEINMMLSIPRTISKKVNVINDIQISGLVNHSII
jgi:hypothetical protein